MTQSNTSHVRRFVKTGMTLLVFQLVAALATIGMTGWAAFYVADLRAERDQLRDELAAVQEAPPAVEPIYYDEPTQEFDVPQGPGQEPDPETLTLIRERTVVTRAPTTEASVRTTRRTAARPAQRTDRPQQSTSTRRRNTTYPGGLPGSGDNSRPPEYVGRPPRRDRGPDTGNAVPNLRDFTGIGGRTLPLPRPPQDHMPEQPSDNDQNDRRPPPASPIR